MILDPAAADSIDGLTVQGDSRSLQSEMRGVRAGAIMAAGIVAANLGNYVFHLVAARFLGPADYGDVAVLLALSGLVTLPLAAVQFAVAGYVARFAATGQGAAVSDILRRGGRLTLLAGAALTLVFAGLALPIKHTLGIGSLAAVALTAALVAPAFVTPVVLGIAQGLQRFALLAAALAAGPALRVVAAAAVLAVGLGVGGAMAATFFGALVTLAVPLYALRASLRRTRPAPLAASRRDAGAYLVPAIVGLLSITSLTTFDVIVAKAVLTEHGAGIYGAGSLIGRVILYLPAAIVTVLLPKVSARTALDRPSVDVLAKSLWATAAFCGACFVVYAAAPQWIVALAYGSEFDDTQPLLWMFGLAMSGFALLNVLLAYHVARGNSRFSWLLLAGAIAQLTGFAVFHGSPEALLTVSIVVAGVLLLLHELLVERTLSTLRPRLSRAG